MRIDQTQFVLDFTSRVALVTGAAAGMGLATARAFEEVGAFVVLADFREDIVKAEGKKVIEAGLKAIGIRCDVSDDAEVKAAVQKAVAEFGSLDAAFNNASVMAKVVPNVGSTREEWDRVIGINLRGVWSSDGVRVAANGEAGKRSHPEQSLGRRTHRRSWHRSSIASKHGVVGLTRTAVL